MTDDLSWFSNRVLQRLAAHHDAVSAIHNHALNITPERYYVHAFATGDLTTVAQGFCEPDE